MQYAVARLVEVLINYMEFSSTFFTYWLKLTSIFPAKANNFEFTYKC